MGYYIRVLTKNKKMITLSKLRNCLENKGIEVNIKILKGSKKWEQILLSHIKGEEEIAIIERNPVMKGLLGKKEINEFLKEIAECKPQSAVKWLSNYLKKVKIIYAIQVLNGAYKYNGWEVIRSIQNELWNTLGGIFQADNEGFSNEEGYHIIWQFPTHIKGSWKMAVLDKHGKWIKFEIDLGNKKHRKTFLAGKIPNNAKII